MNALYISISLGYSWFILQLWFQTTLTFGTSAACRRDEPSKMTVHDVKDGGDVIIVLIPSTKTKHPRSSCVTEPPWLNIIRKYMSLRPFGTP
jgi:hypothetical protein